jgi:transcriptional regulator
VGANRMPFFMLTFNMSKRRLLLITNMKADRADILQGTLDLMVLKTLDTLGSMHGFGIAKRIQQISKDALHLNQGTLYPALVRLEQRGWIAAKWGTSDNNRKAKFYSLTKRGRHQLEREAADWHNMSAVINRMLLEGE